MKSVLISLVAAAVFTPILFVAMVIKADVPFSWETFLALYCMCAAAVWFLTVRDERAEKQVKEGRELLSVNIMSNDPLVKVICSDQTLAFDEVQSSVQSRLVQANWILHTRNAVVNAAVCSLNVTEPSLLAGDLRKELQRIAITAGGGRYFRPLVAGVVLFNEGSSIPSYQLVDSGFAGRGGIGWVIQIRSGERRVDACQIEYHLSISNIYGLLLQHLGDSGFHVEACSKKSLLSFRSPTVVLIDWLMAKWGGKR